MNHKFNLVKTIQLLLYIVFTVAALLIIFRDPELYGWIAQNAHIRYLAIILWLVIGLGFVFLFYDFNSFSDLKRENMELDAAIYSDALTGIANRYSVDVYLGRFLNKPLPEDMGCVTIDLTNLSEINEKLGHQAGDEAIREFSDILQQAASGVCFIGRNGGNKFLAIFRECSENRLDSFLEAIASRVQERNQNRPDFKISYCTGKAFDEGGGVHTLTELVALSDRRAFENIRKNL
jgi:diguanylate cyclase (GGDEF)-like protein